jgi:TPR repeat protein
MKLTRILRLSFASLILVLAISVNLWANGEATDFNDVLEPAQKGDPNAQVELGWMYYKGEDVTQDYQKALEWFRKAAEQGDAKAQVALGGMYEVGKGVPKNKRQAVMWYQKAAERGYSEAQYICGLMYLNGVGVSKDYKQALQWFTKASEQGHFMSSCELGEIYEEGKAVPQDYQQAVKWFLKSIEQGHYNVSDIRSMYEKGKCELKEYEKAVKMIQKAAEEGKEFAQFELAEMYLHGDIIYRVDIHGQLSEFSLFPQDYQQAINWHLKLAERGGSFAHSAQYQLGWIYSEGRGVPQNYVEAYKWFILASLEPDKILGEDYTKARDELRLKMSPQQIAEAQKLAKEFKSKIDKRSADNKKDMEESNPH